MKKYLLLILSLTLIVFSCSSMVTMTQLLLLKSWGIVENPTIEDSTIKSDVATDNFDIKITGLEANTTYYARAFAENKWGISYGNEITFTTLSIVATPVISPSGGTFYESQTITMTCDDEDAKIMYTLDGSNPNESSTLYTGYFEIP